MQVVLLKTFMTNINLFSISVYCWTNLMFHKLLLIKVMKLFTTNWKQQIPLLIKLMKQMVSKWPKFVWNFFTVHKLYIYYCNMPSLQIKCVIQWLNYMTEWFSLCKLQRHSTIILKKCSYCCLLYMVTGTVTKTTSSKSVNEMY